MIHENGHYVVVEKTGPDATEAVRLDPRRATPPTGDRRRHSN